MMWNLAKCKMLLCCYSHTLLLKTIFKKFHLLSGEGVLGSLDIVAKVSGNRTDLVKLIHASTSCPSEVQKYMVRDFEKYKMPLQSQSLIKLFLKASFIFW